MKYLTVILLFLSSLCYSQVTHSVKITGGTTWGTHDEVYYRVACNVTEDYIILQTAYLTNFDEHYLQAKLGFGIVKPKWRLYAYLPYLNYSITESGYNTPMCFEFFYGNNFSINWDIYSDYIVPSLRFHVILYENKPIIPPKIKKVRR